MATEIQSVGEHDTPDLNILDDNNQDGTPARDWTFLGHNFPRAQIVFLSQVVIIYVVIISSIVNLSVQAERPELWSSLLSGSLGYLLPSPTIRTKSRR